MPVNRFLQLAESGLWRCDSQQSLLKLASLLQSIECSPFADESWQHAEIGCCDPQRSSCCIFAQALMLRVSAYLYLTSLQQDPRLVALNPKTWIRTCL